MFLRGTFLVAALVVGTSVASAADHLNFSGANPGDLTGDIHFGSEEADVYIGLLDFTDVTQGDQALQTICASISEEIYDGDDGLYNVYDTNDGSVELDPDISSAALAHAGGIVEEYWSGFAAPPDGLTAAQYGAAMQIAVWSALYDSSYDSGIFSVDPSFGNADVMAEGATMFSGANASNGPAIWFQYVGSPGVGYEHVGGQDQLLPMDGDNHINVSNVPGPAAGLVPLAFAFLRRRRR